MKPDHPVHFPAAKKNDENYKKTKLLFKLIPVTIHGPKGAVETFAMLDDGANFSLITPYIAKKVGLEGQEQMIKAKGAWTSSASQCTVQNIKCDISNANGKHFTLRARIMEGFDLSSQRLSKTDVERYPPIRNLESVLSFYNTKAQILIGHDHYHLMVTKKFIIGGKYGPYATKTPLGWCVHGIISSKQRKHK